MSDLSEQRQSAPKAFISHASEDKVVVRPMAEQLRARGVNAWLDEWEIQGGDSLVKKIFTEGIEEASVFIVMLSRTSVTKPWVREELDVGVVRKIEDEVRLIPVLLDDVEVPSSLRHLLYLSVPKLGMEKVIDALVDSVFRRTARPDLGPIPGYATETKRLLGDPVDDSVLDAIISDSLEKGETNIDEDDLVELLKEVGLDRERIEESIATLEDSGHIDTEHSLASYTVTKVVSKTWLAAAANRGIDVDTSYKTLLVRIVSQEPLEDFDEVDNLTRDALLDLMELEGYISLYHSLGGSDAEATVKGKRLARSF
jgi:hypothetical protein